jgi:hypothetical protein
MAPLNAGLFLGVWYRVLAALRPRRQLSGLSRQVTLSSATPYGFEPGRPTPGHVNLLRPPGFNTMRWFRNINRIPIIYAFRPRLRLRLTLGG